MSFGGHRFSSTNQPVVAGRKPIAPAVREALRDAGPRAAAVLIALLDCDDPKLQFLAAKEVLDRLMGKAVTPLEVSGPEGAALSVQAAAIVVGGWSSEQLEAFARLDAGNGSASLEAASDSQPALAGDVVDADFTPSKG